MVHKNLWIKTTLLCGSFFFFYSYSFAKTGLADYKKGYQLYQQGHYQEALKYFYIATDEDMDFWQSYHMIGNCYFQLRQKDNAIDAFKESLRIHPNNPTLVRNLRDLDSGVFEYPLQPLDEENPHQTLPEPPTIVTEFAMARVSGLGVQSPGAEMETEERPDDTNVNHNVRAPLWMKLNSSYGFAGMGDLSSGAVAWNKTMNQNGTNGYAIARNTGVELGLESGYTLDKDDSLSLGVDYLGGEGYSASLVSPANEILQAINPATYSLSVNYYRYLTAGNNRLFVMGGMGYYMSMVSYFESGPGQPISGNFNGGNLGGTIGVGNEWYFSKAVGIELSGRMRFANISHIQGEATGLPAGSSGTAALAILKNGTLGVQNTQTIGQNGNSAYASIDYTGFDLKLAMDIYPF